MLISAYDLKEKCLTNNEEKEAPDEFELDDRGELIKKKLKDLKMGITSLREKTLEQFNKEEALEQIRNFINQVKEIENFNDKQRNTPYWDYYTKSCQKLLLIAYDLRDKYLSRNKKREAPGGSQLDERGKLINKKLKDLEMQIIFLGEQKLEQINKEEALEQIRNFIQQVKEIDTFNDKQRNTPYWESYMKWCKKLLFTSYKIRDKLLN